MERSRIEEFGSILRFLTPIMLAVIGYTSIQYLAAIDRKFENIDNKFNKFMESYHFMDKRVDRLEYRVFGEQAIRTTSSLDN